ncbi:MAG TPA: ribonuclease HI [Anaerolineales bacterium]|nr:ribonuclease HI [Anaerolineales bacterium]HLO29699.1 ribonuclease HI [Anaerolineales bacterium]
MADEKKEIAIYTDGACDPNPGAGGYGAVLLFENKRKEISGGFRLTTNNRMEIYAAIKSLELLKQPCRVTLYSDSRYLVSAMMEGWVEKWKKRNWWRTHKEHAVNVDLWEKLSALCETHEVNFVWVKGHDGNPENERCDQLSYAALRRRHLPPDEVFENPSPEPEPIKMTHDGQPCRKCSTPVIKLKSKKFKFYLFCPNCKATYEIESDKRDESQQATFF